MIISHTHRFIYFGLMRTASSSITKALVDNFGAEYYFNPDWEAGHTIFKSLHGKAQHQKAFPAEFESYFTFTSVRDPVTRFQSMYLFFGEAYWGMNSFEDMLANPPPTMIQELFGDPVFPGCIPVRIDKYLYFENIEEEFNSLPFVTEPVELLTIHDSHEPPPALQRHHLEFIQNYYLEDFTTWSYTLPMLR